MGSVLSTLAAPQWGERFLWSRPFQWALSSLLATEAAIIVLWTIPSTFVIKRAYLRWVSSSPRVKATANCMPFGFAVLLWVLLRERFCSAALSRVRDAATRAEARLTSSRSWFALLLLLFVNRAYKMTQSNLDLLMSIDQRIVDREMLAFKPPSVRTIEMVTNMYRSVCNPVFIGMENIPTERPLLFVSNHTILGLELPLLLYELYKEKGIFLRALADRSHFQIPVSGAFLRTVLGAVDGTQRVADLLMESKQPVFVYPGGARETFKRTTDKKYELFWKDHIGFAKLAIKHGCTIVPVINIGTEDMAEVVYDVPLQWVPIPHLYGKDRTFPILKPPSLHSLQRVYFVFGEPIRTTEFGGAVTDVNAQAVRDRCKRQVDAGIHFLQQLREGDSHRFAEDRLPALRSLLSWVGSKARSQERLQSKL